MTDTIATEERTNLVAAALSALIPGLGQAVKRQRRHAALVFLTGVVLLAGVWGAGRIGGRGADTFVLMLIVLPWWVIQAYDAALPPAKDGSGGLRRALSIAWERAHDIRFLGALFLLTAVMDLYIIMANPAYALTIFCGKPTGLLGILAKAQSPTLHIFIGYGFLRLRRWSLLLYLAYAAFGLMNATVNLACLGYGRVRTVFLITLIAFTVYVIWRRDRFQAPLAGHTRL
jgi:hypothetical protein